MREGGAVRLHAPSLSCVARSGFLACQPLLLGRSDAASFALIRYFLYFLSFFQPRIYLRHADFADSADFLFVTESP